MKKWGAAILTTVFLTIFLYGCAGVARDTKVKCQRCGTTLGVNEGMEDYRKANRGGETRVN